MTFTRLLAMVGSPSFKGAICADSRRVGSGDIFVAVKGTHADGHDFIAQARENGASYIVCQEPAGCTGDDVVVVADSASALGLLAQQSFGNPSAQLTNLAVTGTNGKTTVSYLVRSVIETAGAKCGLIGTIVYDTGTVAADATLTTPDALAVAQLARKMADDGAEFMVTEASSHALSQNRLAGVDFTAAAFTNLTGDHLDYHKTAEEYLAAKMRLFTQLPCHATAVLNAESPAARQIAQNITTRVFWYGIDTDENIAAHINAMDADRTLFTLSFDAQQELVQTSLIGRHNISNHLAAAGLCLAAGFDLATIAKGLSSLKAVPGRLEAVECGQDFTVLVDYAHTDDALKNVLDTLRTLTKNKLIVLFGCGGDRDKTKRPRMAKVAEELADRIVVTSDNPRTEDADTIIEHIVAGFTDPNAENITVQPDRHTAIEQAIASAEPGDIVLLAGKGHETYQIIGTEKIDFDDRNFARQCLQNI
ncbi:MAG: UDP-N-acetylmuramoyl-L-alanyl-D-glutamate--2,6-diaminopimelate ligase [Planctomycetes bacterium]|nr:UDP-N-acetylmuramoyl-L-alanyl-D-glutamate--2,6-diaminopimelate ligase [Planctomycetota bacterium]